MRPGFIGTGKVGSAFGILLAERGYQVSGCMDIKPEEALRFATAISGCRIYDSQQSLAQAKPSLVPLYRALGRRTLPIARAKGTLSEEDARVLADMFWDIQPTLFHLPRRVT